MPTDRPLKSVNLDPEDHKLAQKLAEKLTELTGRATEEIIPGRSRTVTIRDAIHTALWHLAVDIKLEPPDNQT